MQHEAMTKYLSVKNMRSYTQIPLTCDIGNATKVKRFGKREPLLHFESSANGLKNYETASFQAK